MRMTRVALALPLEINSIVCVYLFVCFNGYFNKNFFKLY